MTIVIATTTIVVVLMSEVNLTLCNFLRCVECLYR
jgi:hypothetical protein